MSLESPASTKTIQAVFLDVDGTYADYGVVPAAHEQAVKDARAAGHKVLICTGRPLPMLPPSILGAGFDGVVASAGAYLDVGGEVLIDRRFCADLAARALAVLDAHNAVYILEAQDAIYVCAAAEARLRAHIEAHFANAPAQLSKGSASILDKLVPLADLSSVVFAKISVFSSPAPMTELVAQIGAGIDVVENSIAAEGLHAGELFQAGISKADGVAAAIAYLGITRENTIAFGDGHNDLEMLAFAGLGVAIEGSPAELLTIADATAPPPRKNGIATAFALLGLN
ncbi:MULTISPECIES: HAD-IIB family hydrolase [Arthrobacter]|uniref:HAD-IIB family hydrolase n=1 Tax=Arthrobacter TaxID=1663 RepID=UPI0028F74A3B|nr:HAD-IIB family hydrolase [Arthrobacter sp. lap29]